MSEINGDDLLKTFKELDIQVLNLNPNVIKAWFDTDDKDMKNLLNWMCTSLSKKNYISPLEEAEYLSITTPLYGEDLEKAKKQLEQEYPGISDVEYNTLEIEFLEAELNLVHQEEKDLDQSILFNRKLEKKLTEDLSRKFNEEIEVSVKLKTTQEKCILASKKLDIINEKIYEECVKCSTILNNFEFSEMPTFISNFDITIFQEKFDNTLSILKPVLDKTFSIEKDTASTISDETPNDDTVANDLWNMRHRLVHSHHKYIASAVEIERLKAILAYLDKFSLEDLLSSDNNALNQNIALKTDTKKRLCDVLEDTTNKLVDNQISQKLDKYMEEECKMHETNLQKLDELEIMIQKLVSHYSLLGFLYDIEKKDMENFEKFFKQVIAYVNRDLGSSVIRTEKMNEVIRRAQSNASNQKDEMIEIIIKLLSNKEKNFTIERAYELMTDLKKEIDRFETKLFSPNFKEIRAKGKGLRESNKILQSFLFSGPTDQVLLVPIQLQLIIREVEDTLKREIMSIKTAVDTVAKVKKIPDKWQNYRRQLWMYFLADPKGLKYIMEQVKKKFESQKSKS